MAFTVPLQQVRNSVVLDTRFSSSTSGYIHCIHCQLGLYR
jgi:hypothetical protein